MKTPIAVGPATYGVDAAVDQVDDRAGRRGDADHHVARRGGDPERDAHRQVHQRHLDDPAADPEQRGDDARRRSPRRRRGRGCGRDSPSPDRPLERRSLGGSARPIATGAARVGSGTSASTARRRRSSGSGVPAAGHRDRHVQEQDREQERQQLLVEQERDRAADERAGRGEQLEGHPEAQVRDVALEVDARPPRCWS